jgi:gliding motility-associated-like protein
MNTTVATPDAIAITGLTPNTIYHYQASDGTDNGSDVTFVTAPNAPTMGAGSNPTNTGFTASWSAPTGMGTAPFTYTVEVSTDPAFGTIVTSQTGISGTSQVFTGLNSTTQYYYRVKAVNATASSAWSATSASISTLIVPTGACTSGTGSGASPGSITYTFTAPVIDGSVDAVWSNVPANQVSIVSVGSGSNTQTTWKAMWTIDTLYLLVQVQDPTLISQKTGLVGSVPVAGATPSNNSNYYESDGVEITLDPDYSHGSSYDGLNDVQFRFNLGSTIPSGQSSGGATQFTGSMFLNVYQKIDYKVVPGGLGYTVEAAIPWGHNAANPGINLTASPSTYGTASTSQAIGLEVQVNDATNTSNRTTQYSWYNSSSAPYQDPSQFAKAQLVPACVTPPTVVNPKVTNITATGATFGATVTSSGDSPLTARGTGYTAYLPGNNNKANENAAPEGGTGVSTYSGPARTGLTPETKYFYRGYATNQHGATGVSDSAFFYTLSALPTTQPTITTSACTQMTLNWTAPAFPSSGASQTGYLLLRADAPASPSTTGITTRIATQQSALAAGTTLIATIPSGATLTYTDATAVAGITYKYMLVPFTWDGQTADSTYNYAVTSAPTVSVSIGTGGPAPTATTVQPNCEVKTGAVSITSVAGLTYSIDGTNYVSASDPIFSTLAVGNYQLTAKDVTGCVSAPTPISIVANAAPCGEFKIPNLITPNNDGHNDNFVISALPAGSKLNIFNRWGDRVYQSSDYDNLWAGSNTSDGIYYYDLMLPDGKVFKGWLEIIK